VNEEKKKAIVDLTCSYTSHIVDLLKNHSGYALGALVYIASESFKSQYHMILNAPDKENKDGEVVGVNIGEK
jgi:hypothetical protein